MAFYLAEDSFYTSTTAKLSANHVLSKQVPQSRTRAPDTFSSANHLQNDNLLFIRQEKKSWSKNKRSLDVAFVDPDFWSLVTNGNKPAQAPLDLSASNVVQQYALKINSLKVHFKVSDDALELGLA